MDGPEYVRRQLTAARRFFDATLKDVTDEELRWMPAGSANPAGAALVHVLHAQDVWVHETLQGGQRIWEREGLGARFGLESSPGRDWDELRRTAFEAEPLLEYGAAVWAATEDYAARLTSEELDRSVTFFRGERPVADVLTILINHLVGHLGEVSALRGMQGTTGLPL